MCTEKIHQPTPEIQRGENTPLLKTRLLKTRENGPWFKKNGILVVGITISEHHMNSTIVFFILCAKNLKKRHITTNYNLITILCFLWPSWNSVIFNKENIAIIMIYTFIFYSFWAPEANTTIHFTLKCSLDLLRSP